VRITYGAKTDTGRQRQHNEDNYLVDINQQLFVVADGMGGHACGEVASAMAVREVHEHLTERAKTDDDPRTEDRSALVQESIAVANSRIFEAAAQDTTKTGMGTTLCMAYIQDKRAYVGHVGDSRVYLLRAGHTHQLTDDHSFLGEMQRHGGKRNVHDVNPRLRNAVTRAIGTQPTVESDALEVDLLPGDRLVLCTDGLHGYTDPSTLHRLAHDAGEDPSTICDHMVDFANNEGGMDNITVVVIHVHATDDWTGQEIEQRLQALRSVGLFRHLSYSELLKVLHVAEERTIAAGEVIFETGTVDDTVYAILDGAVRVQQENLALSVLSAGHHFGELALVDDTPRTVTAQATCPTRLLSLNRDGFYRLLRGDTQVATKLLWSFVKSLTIRLHSMSNRMALGESLYRRVSDMNLEDTAPRGWIKAKLPSQAPPPLPTNDKRSK